MLDAVNFPDRPNAVGVSYARTSEFTRRDFMFTSLGVTDDDAYLDTVDQSYNFGTITLELWHLHVEGVVSKPLEHQPGNQVLEGQVVHERSKKAGTHHVKYGEEYYSPSPVVDVVSAHTIGAGPYASFTFKYRPIEMLMAGGIVPRPIDNRAEEIRALEDRLAALRTKVKAAEVPPPPRRKIKTEPGTAGFAFGRQNGPPEIIDLTSD
ncbi:hypothetical protein DXG01_004069 [Tephrocybe rancida]|nr:hypothetical protein DXG01_004069 [Tephrocybe rancida]